MSGELVKAGDTQIQVGFNREQVELIKRTVAVGATDDELKLFLYVAKKRGLDPLTKQIYFIKRKRTNPVTKKYEDIATIQTGIDGFRLIASRTGQLSGIRRGVIKEGDRLVGGWAEVYRNDWQHPAREEVSLQEYMPVREGKPQGLWATMPETMIKKVAEAAALRMAFPEPLSGIYSDDEMAQADCTATKVVSVSSDTIEVSSDDWLNDGEIGEAPTIVEALTVNRMAERGTEAVEEEKKEHWCYIHDCEFFKKGKMTGYAHPIKDQSGETTDWCNEDGLDSDKKNKITPVQKKKIQSEALAKGYTKEQADNLLKQMFPNCEAIAEMTMDEADLLIDSIMSGVGLG